MGRSIADSARSSVRDALKALRDVGSVRRLKEEEDRLGLQGKRREGKGAEMRGGRLLGRGFLYHLLSNPIYIGRIPHNGDRYEGQHPAIVDPETGKTVQKRQAKEAATRPSHAGRATISPLRGKLFDDAGTPTHAELYRGVGPSVPAIRDAHTQDAQQ
jgi:hypothetical protein